MPKISKKKYSPLWIACIALLALANLAALTALLVDGKNVALFNPKGLIAWEQHSLMIYTMSVLLVIVIPTIFVAFYIAWKYRESNQKVVPATAPSRIKHLLLGVGIWTIPITVLVILAGVMLPATQRLAPQKSIAAGNKPLRIQVISLRWKWLFIYPEQQIASVNFVQVPVNTPIEFELTADETPMSSFWIPNLGGQLYAMTSHVNRLNLMAENPGDYPGSSAEINGRGFAGMKFTARASGSASFEEWVQKVKQSPEALDAAKYQDLLKPSENNPVVLYSAFDPNLYDAVVMKYTGPHGEHKQ